MNVEYTETAWEDLSYSLENDLSIVKKIKELIACIVRTPTNGIGKPEPLKHEFKGCRSRRINRAHRMVYKITSKNKFDQKCTILQCSYYYEK